LHLADAEGGVGRLAGEQPTLGTIATPRIAELPQQQGRQGHQAVLVSLGGADVQEHPLAVDVGDVQGDGFGDTPSGGVGGLQQEPVAWVGDGLEEPRHLVAAEDGGDGFGHFAVGAPGDAIGSLQGDGVEEAECGDGVVESAPGVQLPEEVQLVLSEVRGVELLGRLLEMLGEACHGREVGSDGWAWVVADAEVVEKTPR
jgi:hypothetical protein